MSESPACASGLAYRVVPFKRVDGEAACCPCCARRFDGFQHFAALRVTQVQEPAWATVFSAENAELTEVLSDFLRDAAPSYCVCLLNEEARVSGDDSAKLPPEVLQELRRCCECAGATPSVAFERLNSTFRFTDAAGSQWRVRSGYHSVSRLVVHVGATLSLAAARDRLQRCVQSVFERLKEHMGAVVEPEELTRIWERTGQEGLALEHVGDSWFALQLETRLPMGGLTWSVGARAELLRVKIDCLLRRHA